jgi:hypothetical protein
MDRGNDQFRLTRSGSKSKQFPISFPIRCFMKPIPLLWTVLSVLLLAFSARAQPDLTKGTDNLSNLNPHPGDTVAASLTIQNQSCPGGSASAGAFHVGFYWSTGPSFSGVSPFYEAPVSGCAASGTVSLDQNVLISAVTTPGTYYLGYRIDDQNEVAECNENNNGIFHWTVTVMPPPQADLTKSTDNLSNLNPHPGDTVAASITIQNQFCPGGSASAGAFHVGFYWSTSPSFNGVSPFLEATVSGCAANGTVSLNQNITIDAGNAPGTYYLGYKIDDQDEVAECDESNNGIFSWTVTVLPPPSGSVNATLANVAISAYVATSHRQSSKFFQRACWNLSDRRLSDGRLLGRRVLAEPASYRELGPGVEHDAGAHISICLKRSRFECQQWWNYFTWTDDCGRHSD